MNLFHIHIVALYWRTDVQVIRQNGFQDEKVCRLSGKRAWSEKLPKAQWIGGTCGRREWIGGKGGTVYSVNCKTYAMNTMRPNRSPVTLSWSGVLKIISSVSFSQLLYSMATEPQSVHILSWGRLVLLVEYATNVQLFVYRLIYSYSYLL